MSDYIQLFFLGIWKTIGAQKLWSKMPSQDNCIHSHMTSVDTNWEKVYFHWPELDQMSTPIHFSIDTNITLSTWTNGAQGNLVSMETNMAEKSLCQMTIPQSGTNYTFSCTCQVDYCWVVLYLFDVPKQGVYICVV